MSFFQIQIFGRTCCDNGSNFHTSRKFDYHFRVDSSMYYSFDFAFQDIACTYFHNTSPGTYPVINNVSFVNYRSIGILFTELNSLLQNHVHVFADKASANCFLLEYKQRTQYTIVLNIALGILDIKLVRAE